MLVTKDIIDKRTIDEIEILLIPACFFLLVNKIVISDVS